MTVVFRGIYRLAGRLPSPVKRFLVRLREPSFLGGVLGVVLDDQGRVLLFRHTYRPFAPWGLPSGWLKEGESLEQSISREIKEETGLDVEFQEILHVEAASRPRRIDVWMKYRALPGTARPSAEVDEAKFFSLEELPDLIESQKRFLRNNRARLSNGP